MDNHKPKRMKSNVLWSKWLVRLSVGLTCGVAIVFVDNFAFEGEVSPIVIVAMLLAVTITAGAVWGRRGWVVSAAAWVCVPLAHVVKQVLGMPDTLHPNTYTSILYLAIFTLIVATVGTSCGVLLRRLITGGVRE